MVPPTDGRHECTSQMASRSVQPFCRTHARGWQTDRQAATQRDGASCVTVVRIWNYCCDAVLFCCLAVLDPRVGHTVDILSPFLSVLCHSD